jgi:hypothetical protein
MKRKNDKVLKNALIGRFELLNWLKKTVVQDKFRKASEKSLTQELSQLFVDLSVSKKTKSRFIYSTAIAANPHKINQLTPNLPKIIAARHT